MVAEAQAKTERITCPAIRIPLPINPGTRVRMTAPTWYASLGLYRTMPASFLGSPNVHYGAGRSASDNDTLFLFLWTAI